MVYKRLFVVMRVSIWPVAIKLVILQFFVGIERGNEARFRYDVFVFCSEVAVSLEVVELCNAVETLRLVLVEHREFLNVLVKSSKRVVQLGLVLAPM